MMYRRLGSPKNARMRLGSWVSRSSAVMILAVKSSGPVVALRPMVSCLTFFQTHSSGLGSGE